MGYYTVHTLEAVYPENKRAKVLELLSEYEAFDGSSTKWYDFSKDCINTSLKIPNVAFVISCWGEEAGDYSLLEFYNGRITYKSEFNG